MNPIVAPTSEQLSYLIVNLEYQLDAANQRIAELEARLVASTNSDRQSIGFQRRRVESQRVRAEAAEANLVAARDALVAILDLPHASVMRVHAHNALTRLGALAQIDAPTAEPSDTTMDSQNDPTAFEVEHPAFEKWAQEQRLDMSKHPLHLFVDSKTSAARQGWRAALQYIKHAMIVAGIAEPSDTELILWELDGDSGVKAFMKSDPNRCAHGGTIAEAVGDLVMSQSNTFAARVQSATQPGKDPQS